MDGQAVQSTSVRRYLHNLAFIGPPESDDSEAQPRSIGRKSDPIRKIKAVRGCELANVAAIRFGDKYVLAIRKGQMASVGSPTCVMSTEVAKTMWWSCREGQNPERPLMAR